MTDRERHILASWHANADAWTRAVRERAIPSRVAVTDNAIVAAVRVCAPRTVLDVGCGEKILISENASIHNNQIINSMSMTRPVVSSET